MIAKTKYVFVKKIILLLKLSFLIIFPPYDSLYKKGEKMCEREIKKRPKEPYTIWFLSYFKVQQEKYEEAKNLLESLIAEGFNKRSVLFLLSKAYFNLGKYADVKKTLEKLDDIPDKEVANYYFGYSLIELHQANKGIKYLEKYATYNFTDYNVFWKIGYEYYNQNQYNKALKAFKRANELNPSKKEIKDCIAQCIKNIH